MVYKFVLWVLARPLALVLGVVAISIQVINIFQGAVSGNGDDIDIPLVSSPDFRLANVTKPSRRVEALYLAACRASLSGIRNDTRLLHWGFQVLQRIQVRVEAFGCQYLDYITSVHKPWIDKAAVFGILRHLACQGALDFLYGRNATQTGRGSDNDIKRRRQWEISGYLHGTKVKAIPDYGSDLDTISEAFARRNNLKIHMPSPKSALKIGLPTGGEIQSLGEVKLPFSFAGEPDVYTRTFTVVKNCIHDVVLGNKFLKLTKTLSHHYHRLKERHLARSSHIPRLCLLNSSLCSERIRGTINGILTNAYPDTGSDIIVISKREATRLNLNIDTDERSQTVLQFADGSYHYTNGMVYGVEWQFGDGGCGTSIRCDLQVLDQLSCDLILSNEFLFDNQVFVNYRHCFYNMRRDKISGLPGNDDNNTARFFLIKEKSDRKPMLKSLRAFIRPSGERTSGPAALAIGSNPVDQRAIEQYRETCRQGAEEDRILGLPQQEQPAALEAERQRRNEWLHTHYSPSISSPSSPSAIPPIPSSCPYSRVNAHTSSTRTANPPTGGCILRTLRCKKGHFTWLKTLSARAGKVMKT